MKKLYVTKSKSVFGIDFESQDVSYIDPSREGISKVIVIPEDCEVTNGERSVPAKTGDVLIVFYEKLFTYDFIVITSPEWKENIDSYNSNMREAYTLDKKSCDTEYGSL